MPEVPGPRDFLGLNLSKPSTNLQLNEASEATNISFSRGRIEKRRGSMRISPYLIPKSSLLFDGTTWAQTEQISSTIYDGLGYKHGSAHTLEMSLQFPSGTSTKTHCIVERGLSPSGGAHGWGLYFYEYSHAFRYVEKLDTGSDIDFYGTYTAFSPNKPHHVSVVRDGSQCRIHVADNVFSGCVGSQSGLAAAAVETSTTNTYPVTWATGVDPDDSAVVLNGEFRIQEFRTWASVVGTATLTSYGLKELPEFRRDDSDLRFYYPFNDGSGVVAADNGKASGVSTATGIFAATLCPSPPFWVSGLVSGGRGDTAVQFDGIDDLFAVPTTSDEYAAFRTGTSDWSVQAKVTPLDRIQNDAVILSYGNGTFTSGSDGFAFKIKASVNAGRTDMNFVAQMCCSTETAEITWSTNFEVGSTYGLTLMRLRDQYWFQVVGEDEDAASVGFSTVGVTNGNPSPGFPAWQQVIVGSAFEPGYLIPASNYANMVLDELRLWNSSRYDDLNTSLGNPHDPDLAGYWRFNDGSGQTVSDASSNQNVGYLLPLSDGAKWAGGFVEPVSGAPIKGIFQYDRASALRNLGDSRNMCSVVCAANSVYRLEGQTWKEIATQKNTENLYCGDQLGDFLIFTNGKDQNNLYDGDVVYDAGIDAPAVPPNADVYALATATFDTQTNGVTWVMGQNLYTTRDSDRNEQGYSLNDKRVTMYIGGSTGTIEGVVEQYFKDRQFKNAGIIASSTDSFYYWIWHPDFSSGGKFPIKKYGMELGEINAYTATGTQTVIIRSEHEIDILGRRFIRTWDSINGLVGFPTGGNYHQVRLDGHFVWKTALSETIYSTTSYRVSLYDGGITGNFFYRYTNYNRYTAVELNPSDPSDAVTSPEEQGCQVSCAAVTDTIVTDRLIYRTKTGGARDGGYYYLLGTLTGTSADTFYDLTPSGQEGRLIDFYRDKPPLSSIVKVFKGRMWYVPVDYPNRLYFSRLDSPAEVDAYNYLVFGDENDYITGLGISNDNLVVFKRYSTWVVSRTDVATSMRPFRISDSIGCVGHHTIKGVGGELLFHAEDGIYALEGSSIRRVSGHKVQFYFDRTDPSRRYEAVACDIRADGVYRVNIAPASVYATTVESGVNSWQLDYHYQVTKDYFSRFEGYSPIWSYGERQVSCYGEYVAEDGTWYPASGDYSGGVYIDSVKECYSEGLGWYKNSSSPTSFFSVDGGAISAGNYTITVDSSLFTDGHGLKGLRCILLGSGGSETLTVWRNSGSEIAFTSPTTLDYSIGDQLFISPIHARYRSGWTNMGSGFHAKRTNKLRLDYRYFANGTMTARLMSGRVTETARHFATHSFAMNGDIEQLEVRCSGKDYMVEFEHVWPGVNFELFGWDMDVSGGRQKDED